MLTQHLFGRERGGERVKSKNYRAVKQEVVDEYDFGDGNRGWDDEVTELADGQMVGVNEAEWNGVTMQARWRKVKGKLNDGENMRKI